MFDCCTASRDCCSTSPKQKKVTPLHTKCQPPKTLRCAYAKCHNTIAPSHLSEWRAAVVGSRMFRFCCDECWHHWLDATKHTNVGTSPLAAFSIASPGTPAIGPRTIFDDIPLLNI
jgi:hypothetical protein